MVAGTDNTPLTAIDPRDNVSWNRGRAHGEEQTPFFGFYSLSKDEVGAPQPALDVFHSDKDLLQFIGILAVDKEPPSKAAIREWIETVNLKGTVLGAKAHQCGSCE